MTTLVTAVYKNGPKSDIGGRGRGLDVYKSSIISISKLGLPLVMYVDPSDVQEATELLKLHFERFEVIPYRLESYEFFEPYMALKAEWRKTQNYNDRNGVLCHLKPYWVMDVVARNPFSADSFLWIDAGLFHHGIFPEKVGGKELGVTFPESSYFPHNQNSIINPTLAKKFTEWAQQGRVFGITYPLLGDHSSLEKELGTDHLTHHVIGGLFGGTREAMTSFFALYRSYLKRLVVDKGYNLLEEQVFSCIYHLHPEMFHTKHFDLWWFHSPGEPCSYLTEERNSFYKLFL